jgi:hypothetical protein
MIQSGGRQERGVRQRWQQRTELAAHEMLRHMRRGHCDLQVEPSIKTNSGNAHITTVLQYVWNPCTLLLPAGACSSQLTAALQSAACCCCCSCCCCCCCWLGQLTVCPAGSNGSSCCWCISCSTRVAERRCSTAA